MDTDPLDSVAEDNHETKLNVNYRLRDVVFAEPLAVTSNKGMDSGSEKIDANTSNLKRDVEINTTDDSADIVCPQLNCDRHFKSVALLKSHSRVHSTNRYSCDICNETYKEKYLLKRHMNIHGNVKKECPVCKKKLSARSNMDLHMRTHDQRRQYVCPECQKPFLRRVTMKVHIEYVHRGRTPLSCTECDILFERRVDYQRHHLQSHVKQRNLACEFCGQLFCTLAALGGHKAKKHASLVGITADNHETNVNRLQDVVFAEPLASNTSNKGIDSASEKFDDNTSNHKRDVEINTTDDSSDIVCPQINCGRLFKSVALLKSHSRVHSTNRYSCDICNETYKEKYLLKRHMNIHGNVKKECPVCKKKLSVRTNMDLHMRTHDQRRQYVCPECQKPFLRRVTMKVHIEYVHRGRTPLSCTECDILFKRRVDYQRHLQTHVKQRNMACEFCGKLFGTLAALGGHRAKKHETSSCSQTSS